MAEFVAKAAIVAHIEEQSREWGEEYDVEQILGDIEDFPAADVVERKQGKWKLAFTADENVYECSECGEYWLLNEGFPYENKLFFCPTCGAKMEDTVEWTPQAEPLKEET